MEPKPLSLERRQEIAERLDYAMSPDARGGYYCLNYVDDVADLLYEVERLEEEVRQARGNRQ